MSKKPIAQRKRLAAIFASFSILIMGSVSLLESMSIDYYSVLNTIEKVVPASFIIGCLGWVMGMILDKPQKLAVKKYNNLYLKTLAKNNLKDDIEKIAADVDIEPEKEPTE